MTDDCTGALFNACFGIGDYTPIARRSIRPFFTGGHQ
jgi:hypothetical protein